MKNICIILLFWVVGSSVSAQQIERQLLSSGGKSGETPDVILMWSIGEAVVPHLESSSLILNQGFQQAEVVDLVPVGIRNSIPMLQIRYFPNPVSNTLEVEWAEGDPFLKSELFLYDMLARVVKRDDIQGPFGRVKWKLEKLSPGIYQMGIQRGKEIAIIGKIVKR